MCKVYTGFCGTNEIEHGLCACTVDNPLAKARGLSLRTGAQTMLYLSLDTTYIKYFIVLEFKSCFDSRFANISQNKACRHMKKLAALREWKGYGDFYSS